MQQCVKRENLQIISIFCVICILFTCMRMCKCCNNVNAFGYTNTHAYIWQCNNENNAKRATNQNNCCVNATHTPKTNVLYKVLLFISISLPRSLTTYNTLSPSIDCNYFYTHYFQYFIGINIECMCVFCNLIFAFLSLFRSLFI